MEELKNVPTDVTASMKEMFKEHKNSYNNVVKFLNNKIKNNVQILKNPTVTFDKDTLRDRQISIKYLEALVAFFEKGVK